MCVCMYDADHIFFLLSDMARNSFNPTTYVKFEATVVFPLYSISSSPATSSLLEVHPAMWKETKGCGIMVFLWHIPPSEDYLAAPICLSTVYTPTGVDQCTCQSITQMIPGTHIVQIEQSWTVGLIQPCSPIYYPVICAPHVEVDVSGIRAKFLLSMSVIQVHYKTFHGWQWQKKIDPHPSSPNCGSSHRGRHTLS